VFDPSCVPTTASGPGAVISALQVHDAGEPEIIYKVAPNATSVVGSAAGDVTEGNTGGADKGKGEEKAESKEAGDDDKKAEATPKPKPKPKPKSKIVRACVATQSANQPIKQLASQAINQSSNQAVKQPSSQPINQTKRTINAQTTNQSTNQRSNSQPIDIYVET
jgi:hypothetical protein